MTRAALSVAKELSLFCPLEASCRPAGLEAPPVEPQSLSDSSPTSALLCLSLQPCPGLEGDGLGEILPRASNAHMPQRGPPFPPLFLGKKTNESNYLSQQSTHMCLPWNQEPGRDSGTWGLGGGIWNSMSQGRRLWPQRRKGWSGQQEGLFDHTHVSVCLKYEEHVLFLLFV